MRVTRGEVMEEEEREEGEREGGGRQAEGDRRSSPAWQRGQLSSCSTSSLTAPGEKTEPFPIRPSSSSSGAFLTADPHPPLLFSLYPFPALGTWTPGSWEGSSSSEELYFFAPAVFYYGNEHSGVPAAVLGGVFPVFLITMDKMGRQGSFIPLPISSKPAGQVIS